MAINSTLLKNKPNSLTKEEFISSWNSIGLSLSALYRTLEELSSTCCSVSREDFDCPNHYAKLAFEAGMVAAYKNILTMLPDSAIIAKNENTDKRVRISTKNIRKE